MPRCTHHPRRTRTAGSHREHPHRGRCPECGAPTERAAACLACAPERGQVGGLARIALYAERAR